MRLELERTREQRAGRRLGRGGHLAGDRGQRGAGQRHGHQRQQQCVSPGQAAASAAVFSCVSHPCDLL
jgi:hypothetical protein